MHLANEPVDALTVIQKCKEYGAEITPAYVFEIVQLTPTAHNAIAYAEIVKQDSMRRQLADLGEFLTHDDSPNPLDTYSEAARRLNTIGAFVKSSTVTSLDACNEFVRYRGIIDKYADMVYVKTGYGKLDDLLGGGLLNEGLYILAARPGAGKSTLGLAIADNVARRGESVLFITREMSVKQLMAKRIARHSSVQSNVVLMGALSPDEYKNVMRATSDLSQRPLYIDEKIATVNKIGAVASGMANLRLLVIDYFGLLTPNGKLKDRYQAMAEMSNELKQLAKKLNIPILCLAQLNRNNEGRQNKKPMLSDLRETGALEQDADGVIFLHRADYYSDNKGNAWDARQLEVILAKNRHGGIGTVNMAFYPATSKITS